MYKVALIVHALMVLRAMEPIVLTSMNVIMGTNVMVIQIVTTILVATIARAMTDTL